MAKVTVITEKLDELPVYEVLEWDQYQTFCSDVLAQRIGVQECRDYLVKGSKQDGIDIYAVEKGEKKKIVAQCKLTKSLSSKKFDELLTKFIDGKFLEEVQEFILCTSFNLTNLNDEGLTIENARKRLKAFEIDLIIWDKRGLSQYLRINPLPHTVYHYFDAAIAKAFYGEIWNEYIDKLNKIPKHYYPSNPDHIERTVIAYIENQKKKNEPNWIFVEEKRQDTIISVFEKSHTRQGRRIILLSVAGYGKTEELNNLASYYSSNQEPIHPIKYFLKDYEGKSIETLMFNYHQNWKNIPPTSLLLLFDGLDEIKEKHYQTFINHLNSFLINNPSTSVLVTSRYNFYDLKNQQLRDFDVYLLHPLSTSNIDRYILKKLATGELQFRKQIDEFKFTEYISNPYYLTRLVRFFANGNSGFPQNKTTLFNRILFEQLDKDESKFNIAELKQQLFPTSQKIAFCMTRSGKSALTLDELKEIVPDNEMRKMLRNFCILNVNHSSEGSWSFEHKNLQEYLCASLLSTYPFAKIQGLISFSFNLNKLLPRFLNTVSFLFELLDNTAPEFVDLFTWLQTYQPELFVRFEKDQVTKVKRQEISKTIINYYKTRNITLRISSNFSIEEIAEFAEIDNNMITFLGNELKGTINNETAYDILQILARCKKSFLYRKQLEDIYFYVLAAEALAVPVKGQCIISILSLDNEDKDLFSRILVSGVDIENYEIRRRLILYLSATSFYEQFVDFILESFKVYQREQKKKSYSGINNDLVGLLLKLKSPQPLKKVLQYCISNKEIIDRRGNHMGLHFDYKDVGELVTRAIELYPEEKSLLHIVYRLYIRHREIEHDDKLFAIFKKFFQDTCGSVIIFKKLYRYHKIRRDLFHFADENNMDFIIDQYMKGNLSDSDAIVIRNRLSWKNRSLLTYYMEKINAVTNNKFKDATDIIDDSKLYKIYQQKNQLMLLNKSLFMEEVSLIFDSIPQKDVSYENLYMSENPLLRPFQYSIVKEEISSKCIHNKTISKEEFVNFFLEEDKWVAFVVEQISAHLKKTNAAPLLPELLVLAQEWLKRRIIAIDFANSITTYENGSFSYNLHIEFVTNLFMQLDVEMEDELLLKLLEADYSGVHSESENSGISGKVLRLIKNPELYKAKVLANIKSGKLAPWILTTHFGLCHQLNYQECCGDLYREITTNKLFGEHEKKVLTKNYIGLGGEISDFVEFLTVPIFKTENDHLISWEWFLLEKFIHTEPDKVAAILLQVTSDPVYEKETQLKAMTLLLQMGHNQGLVLWSDFIRKYHKLPSEHDLKSMQEYLSLNSRDNESLRILLDSLNYSYENRLFADRSYLSIQDFIHNILVFLSSKDVSFYDQIKHGYEALISKYKSEEFVYQLYILLERFHQKFYENHEYEISIPESAKQYDVLVQ